MPCIVTLRNGDRLELDHSASRIKYLRYMKRVLTIRKEQSGPVFVRPRVRWWNPLTWFARVKIVRPEHFMLDCSRITRIEPI